MNLSCNSEALTEEIWDGRLPISKNIREKNNALPNAEHIKYSSTELSCKGI
jgi:hypothetical protein